MPEMSKTMLYGYMMLVIVLIDTMHGKKKKIIN